MPARRKRAAPTITVAKDDRSVNSSAAASSSASNAAAAASSASSASTASASSASAASASSAASAASAASAPAAAVSPTRTVTPFWTPATDSSLSALSQALWMPERSAVVPQSPDQLPACLTGSWFSADCYTTTSASSAASSNSTIATTTRGTAAAPPGIQTVCTNNAERITYSSVQLEQWRASTDAGKQQAATDATTAARLKRSKSDKDAPSSCQRIRLQPTSAQSDLLRRWLGTNRWTWNKCVASGLSTKKQLRAAFVHNGLFTGSSDPEKPQWVLDTPYEVRDAAVCDFVKACKMNREQIRLGKRPHTASVGFRSKKDRQQSFVVGLRAYYQRESERSFSMFRSFFATPVSTLSLLRASHYQ